jgi:hypothetical protein
LLSSDALSQAFRLRIPRFAPIYAPDAFAATTAASKNYTTARSLANLAREASFDPPAFVDIAARYVVAWPY